MDRFGNLFVVTNEDFRAGNNSPPALSQGMLKTLSYLVLISRHCRILSLKQDKCTASMLTLVGCALFISLTSRHFSLLLLEE